MKKNINIVQRVKIKEREKSNVGSYANKLSEFDCYFTKDLSNSICDIFAQILSTIIKENNAIKSLTI